LDYNQIGGYCDEETSEIIATPEGPAALAAALAQNSTLTSVRQAYTCSPQPIASCMPSVPLTLHGALLNMCPARFATCLFCGMLASEVALFEVLVAQCLLCDALAL
jgi:hypothetical protein